MPSDSAGRRLPEPPGENRSERLGFDFEGEAIEARRGDSVAAALVAAGHGVTRTTPVSGSPRGPFCMMGVCFECLLEIDGEPNRQGCMVPARAGMQVRRMEGARRLEREDRHD